MEEAEGDNLEGASDNEGVEDAQQGRMANLINALKTNRRYQFIAGGVLLVILIIASFSIFSPKEQPNDIAPGMTQAEAPNFSSEEIVNKKSAKRRRKNKICGFI